MRRLLFAFFILPSLLFCMRPTSAPCASQPPSDLTGLLPSTALVVVDAPDMPALRKKVEASSFYRFYHDPRAAAFFRTVRDESEGFQRRLGLPPDRLRAFFSGQVVLAGIATGSTKQPLEWVVLARHNGDPQVLGRLQRPPAPPGATLRRIPDKYKDFDIVRFEILHEQAAAIPSAKPRKKKNRDNMLSLSAEDLGQAAPQNRQPPQLTLKKQTSEEYEAYFTDSLMIFAGARNTPLHKVLDQLAGASDRTSLARQAEFIQARQATGPGDLTVYASLGRLLSTALRSGDKPNPVFNPAGLALEEFKAAALSINLKPGRATLDAALLAPEPRYGISRILFLPATPTASAAALVPAGANACLSLAIDLPKLWTVLLDTVRIVSPPAYAVAEAQFKGFEQGTGLKVQRDLAGQLGDQIASFHLPADPIRGGSAPETFMVALRDGAAFRDALKAMLDFSTFLGAYHILVEKNGPWPLWTLAEGIPGATAAAGVHPLVYLCVTDRWLLAGTRRGGIDAVVKHLADPAAPAFKSQAFYQRITPLLPAGRFTTAVIESGGLYRLAAGLLGLRESPLLPVAAAPGKSNGSGNFGLKSSRLPQVDAWNEYFGAAGSALSRDEGLIRFHALFEQRGAQ